MEEHVKIEKLMEDAKAWIHESGFTVAAGQIRELQEQYLDGRWNIAFCGHFSAGKSSLINALSGRQLLPSGPIPTTANIIRIHDGTEQLTLYRRNEQGELIAKETISGTFEQLKSFTTEDTVYDVVKVEAPLPDWGGKITFVDTPGADSTDERHHQATARALPLADLVCYVTDYNHVLSEVNMTTMQQLQKMGKWFIFIVNQVDKHREEEIPFQKFQKAVNEALEDWQVNPEQVWYVSTQEQDHPLSEWHELKQWLLALKDEPANYLPWSGYRSMQTIVRQHLASLDGEIQQQMEELQAGQNVSFTEFAEAMNKREEELSIAKAMPEQKEQELKRELNNLIQNANIIPAVTRDLAHDFLQSQQSGFRKGWLFAKKKTEQEKARLLSIFHKAFIENIQTQIVWHVKDLLRKSVQSSAIKNEDIENQLEQFDFKVSEEWLVEQIQTGAVFSNEYTMTYMKRVSESVKTQVKQLAFVLVEQLKREWTRVAAQTVDELTQQFKQEQQSAALYEQWLKLYEQQQNLKEAANKFLAKPIMSTPVLPKKKLRSLSKQVDKADEKIHQTVQSASDSEPEWKQGSNEAAAAALSIPQNNELEPYQWKQTNERTAMRLQTAAELVEKLPGMQELAQQMYSKGERLRKSQFTAALFGAFSAGKSSFANALTGHSILSVSPHPTTAAITRILAPTAEYKHQTAVIHLKTIEQLQEEVEQAISQLGVRVKEQVDLEAWMRKQLPSDAQNEGARRARAFLKSLQAGWDDLQDQVGQTIQTTMETFHRFSAEESHSVYVESIDLYYSSPLTEAGVILVDTPGADSLNARHTGVAFEYIKNADAILFVTYYNHAFTQADRMFLEQLSGVKDQFSLDKMFFIINASDLASNEEELNQVLKHVESNLAKSEIRNPHLYPVSSIQALAGKQSGDRALLEASGMARFEEDWLRFMQDEIAAIAAHSAQHDIDAAVHLIERWLKEAKGQQLEKERKQSEWQQAKKEAEALYTSVTSETLLNQLDQELQELMFYVKQRIQFRFGDWFKTAFHPSSLSTSNKEGIRTALAAAANECYHLINQGCLQEALTTSLRIEKYVFKAWEAWDRQLMDQLSPLYTDYEWQLVFDEDWDTPKLEDRMEPPNVDDRWLRQHFQNAKVFFEQGGRDRMRAELEKLCMVQVDLFIDQLTSQMKAHYRLQIKQKMQEWQSKRIAGLTQYADGWLDILANPWDESLFIQIKSKLMEL